MLERRSFITGLVSALAAPAIVRAGSLMPVKNMLWTPPTELIGWDVGELSYQAVIRYVYDKQLRTIHIEKIDQKDFYLAPA